MNPQDNRWYPVAHSTDLTSRHVFHGQLQGVELALWRDDDRHVNAWENRCPHRSVRFTLGVNLGSRLRCQYHGWQYQSSDGRCTLIPAASQSTPPTSLCARPFAVKEVDGFIWVNLEASHGHESKVPAPDFALLPTKLRSLPFNAPLSEVIGALACYCRFDPDCQNDSVELHQTHTELQVSWRSGEYSCQIHFCLQPASAERTVVHSTTLDNRPEIDELRWHNQMLTAVRQRLESRAAIIANTQTPRLQHMPQKTSPAAQRSPAQSLDVEVVERWATASEIVALKLALPAGGTCAFEAGAHIDVHTPSGHVRQYSLVNAPDEREHLVIGVKLEAASRGGSSSVHNDVQVGDRLHISAPKNNFRLVPEAGGILIAGGIGITPILAMGTALQHAELPYELHYFVRSDAHVAFPERLYKLQHNCIHAGLNAEQTRERLSILLKNKDPDTHVYVCGPKPLIDLVALLAAEAGLNDRQIHFELFANEVTHEHDQPFRVRLQHSGEEFTVPVGASLADTLKARGIAVDTSCEQGVCGTCRTGVVDGEPEHRDVFLTREEQQSNRCLMPCVSRSKSKLLVLDL